MMAGRARECLKALHWSADDVAQELGQSSSDVTAWLEGRASVPIVVIAWLEALVKAHRSVPAPHLDLDSSSKKPALAHTARMVLPQESPQQRSRRPLVPNAVSPPPVAPPRLAEKGSSHGLRSL